MKMVLFNVFCTSKLMVSQAILIISPQSKRGVGLGGGWRGEKNSNLVVPLTLVCSSPCFVILIIIFFVKFLMAFEALVKMLHRNIIMECYANHVKFLSLGRNCTIFHIFSEVNTNRWFVPEEGSLARNPKSSFRFCKLLNFAI